MISETIKATDSDIRALLSSELGEMTDDNFIVVNTAGVIDNLKKNPKQYRAYGAFWWPLKRILIERNFTDFGETVEAITVDKFSYSEDALTLAAAWDYYTMRFEQGLIYAATHVLPTEDGEGYHYDLLDEDMEFLIMLGNGK